MGIGDIPCYGNKTVPMPNVRNLCKSGATLKHHTTPATICTPSRAAFQTGRYGIRFGMVGHGGKGLIDTPPVSIWTAGRDGLPQNETTIGTVAKKAGYNTGFIGKWHLGLNEHWYNDMKHGPLGHGYDYFFGLPYTLVTPFETKDSFFTMKRSGWIQIAFIMLRFLPARFFLSRGTFYTLFVIQGGLTWFFVEHFNMHVWQDSWWGRSDFMYKFMNSYLMENLRVVEKPISLEPLALRMAKKATDFLERASLQDKPFLLIHSFAHVHEPLYTSPEFAGVSRKHGKYGDALIETDHCVGLIMDKLRELDMDKDTFVYFTSDHGGNIQVGREGGFNGPFRGGKGNGALEGGMRIPGLVVWPGVVQPGIVIDDSTSNMDILPTVAEIAGSSVADLNLDGQSLVPLLKDNKEPPNSRDRILYHFCYSQIFAMRLNYEGVIYKAIFKQPKLYNDGKCPGAFCKCYKNLEEYDEPKIFDIDKELKERETIEKDTRLYEKLMDIITTEKAKFEDELERTKMPSQFSHKLSVFPHPWLQPAWFPVQY